MVGILAKTHFIGAELPGLRRPGSGQRRIKGQKGEGHCFHVMSRLTGDVPMWDALEKEAMVKLLWKMSAFCGVELLTYCVMGNHFHALVRVPDREQWLREKFGAAEVPGAANPACADGIGGLAAAAAGGSGSPGEAGGKALRPPTDLVHQGLRELPAQGCGGVAGEGAGGGCGEGAGVFPAEVLRCERLDQGGEAAVQQVAEQAAGAARDLVDGEIQERAGAGRRSVADDGVVHRFESGAGGHRRGASGYRWSGYGAAAGGSKAEQAGLCEVMGRDADAWKESAAVYAAGCSRRGWRCVGTTGRWRGAGWRRRRRKP